ncbi:hypothetical protein TrST_g10111 [Triparma strigata]|uniref:Uncharacterized protein n=1 Tax=Triparma strigata TaxID=1606541 RepID=A0A9W7E3S1_9STRA|nr:hypothetical protein TrST_g10111 [Triparma strigata]
MSAPLPTTAPTLSLSQLRSFLEHSAEQFLLQNKSITEGDLEFVRNLLSDHLHFVTSSDNIASFDDKRKQLGPAIQADASAHEQAIIVPPQGFSSVGKVLSSAGNIKSTPSRVTLMMSKNKIMPMESQSSTALSVLSSPEATKYTEAYNKDLETESEIVRQMDNVVQHYTETEDEMILSGIGLLDGMKMKGAIPYKEFKTAFSTTRVQKGFYNSQDGDIYIKTEYTFNLNTSNFGLRLRVFGGAVLSMVDLITDIYMTVKFFNTEGQEGYGRINVWLIVLTMTFQILVSYLQNSKKPSVFIQDTFFTLIGFRPALDAYRVGSGSEQEDHHLLNPLTEMIWCKATEMVFEAIPASIVQVYALVLAKEKRIGALMRRRSSVQQVKMLMGDVEEK